MNFFPLCFFVLVFYTFSLSAAFLHPPDLSFAFTSRTSSLPEELQADNLLDAYIKMLYYYFLQGPNMPPPVVQASTFDNCYITGKSMFTFMNKKPVAAFMGIRYAFADRFKPPRAAGKYWEGDLTAHHHGFKCPQVHKITKNVTGQEDCLYLNIFTPMVGETVSKKLPVMVYIHGGSFIRGSNEFFLPTFLLEEDIILVVINYRVGPFGFLNLNNEDAKGNYGLYDQIEALKWVNRHIEDFGGDKNSVTLFGQSAGSASVHYHLIMEASKNLYHRAICQSGSAFASWAFDENPEENALHLAEACGCSDREDISECMSSVSVEKLVEAFSVLMSKDHSGVKPTRPSIQNADVINPILTKSPQDAKINDVPLMIGVTKHEGAFSLANSFLALLQPMALHLNSFFMKEKFLALYVESAGIQDKNAIASMALQNAYCGNVNLGNFNQSAPCLIDILSVLVFKASILETTKQHWRETSNRNPAFLYSFEFENNLTLSSYFFDLDSIPFETGISHADDLLYLFPFTLVFSKPHLETTRKMVKLWANFATYGNPTPHEDHSWENIEIPKWTPFEFQKQQYMKISDQLSMKLHFKESWKTTN